VDKQHILHEIRRTAEANGGVPLGFQAFATQTGITVGAWRGVFWARWSDALREAGYQPNEWSRPHDEGHLLDSFASLTLELRHLPTQPEIRMKRRRNPGFPCASSFRRLGTKGQLVAKVAAHFRGHAGHEEVVRWCDEHAATARVEHVDKGKAETQDGEIYLMKSGRFHKIGRSNAAGRREYEVGIQLPEDVNLVHVIRTDDPTGIEAYWHKRFESKRKKGEWFDLDAADIRAFKRRKFM